MTRPLLKTKAQQRLEQLEAIGRPLTDRESDDLRKAIHAVYVRELRQRRLAQHRNEELALLEKLREEAQQPSVLA